MSKEDIIRTIELIDEELKQNEEAGFVYIPTSGLLMYHREALIEVLLYDYGIVYD